MLGKLSSLLSYWKVLEVYTLKRFPSNKVPLFGMVLTNFILVQFIYSYIQCFKIEELRNQRKILTDQKVKDWQFNSTI